MISAIVNDKLIIIFRSDGYRQDCGAVAERVCNLIGKGGGHRSAARIEIPLDVLKAELKDGLSQQSMDHFLNQCLKKGGMSKPDSSAIKTEEDKL